MWFQSPSVESLTRPRVAVALVSAVAAASLGYYAYASSASGFFGTPPGAGLHRSNAVRRNRRSQRHDVTSSSSSDAPAEENPDPNAIPEPLQEWESVPAGSDEWWNDPNSFPNSQRAGHNIVNLLFRVSEDNARRNGCVHRGCQCNACGMVPIRGVRYRCANCADFDLCETCESQGVHMKTHVFYKIRVPAPPFGPRQMQPVWYTGNPDTCPRNLPKTLIGKLSRDTGFERPELEAFWEQWTFMANTEWRDDPDDLGVAMDRKTFERCLVPTGGSRHAAPNLIHDRMFSFYDTNHDDLIGFREFLHGLSYRKRKDKLHKVFEGYDIDGDGYVDRRDFLRMFRAYYVLYKQMHKDILDGLEDQLLASTEAQQLVSSRQPLSSLFGQEGRVPAADGAMRFEGKTIHRDGGVDVEEGYEEAVANDQPDTSSRQEILTSLFAYDSDPGSQRRRGTARGGSSMITRRLSGSETGRAYWVTLIEPPATLEELPSALMMEDHILDFGDLASSNEDEENKDPLDETDAGPSGSGGPSERHLTESEERAAMIERKRRQIPRMEKKRRDMARKHLHDRWQRRRFYLDEEEGALAPDDWEDEEDILDRVTKQGESSKSSERFQHTRSRSSSKVRFAEDMDDVDTHSNHSTSTRSIPERWGGFEIAGVERDAGKEILYQVTQQAFNELLDTIFKAAEDLAVQAAQTKHLREKYKDVLNAMEATSAAAGEQETPGAAAGGGGGGGSGDLSHDDKMIAERTLEELLSEAGYTVEETDERRNAVELDDESKELLNEEMRNGTLEEAAATPDRTAPYRDPTMPQFRPNSDSDSDGHTAGHLRHSESNRGKPNQYVIYEEEEPEEEPAPELLALWKRLNDAEAEAQKRGAWGKLSYEEFETIFSRQETQGNRLDYLGSWIDFCIP